MATITEKITAIIVDKLNISESDITPDKTFTDLSADSLDTVELIMEFEKEFDIKIPDEEAEEIKPLSSNILVVVALPSVLGVQAKTAAEVPASVPH